MLPPLLVSVGFGDGEWPIFVQSFAIIVLAGLALWWTFRNARDELRLRDGFLVVAMFWIVLGSFSLLWIFLGWFWGYGFLSFFYV